MCYLAAKGAGCSRRCQGDITCRFYCQGTYGSYCQGAVNKVVAMDTGIVGRSCMQYVTCSTLLLVLLSVSHIMAECHILCVYHMKHALNSLLCSEEVCSE